MASRPGIFFSKMNLSELREKLSGKTRDELVGLIFSLSSFDRLLSARQIAEASGISKRDVLQAMKAGAFIDPLFGRGFFCRASNSLRVTATAANAWRRSFFVPVNPITGHKKGITTDFGVFTPTPGEMGLGGKKIAQKAVRELSPEFLTEIGRSVRIGRAK